MNNVKVAIVVAEFNKEVTEKLLEGALNRFREREVREENISVTWVPGAVELPLIAQRYATTKRFDAVIMFGAVIRGETDHYDWVCSQVSYGCQKVALENDLPVIFGVLTVDTDEQAADRIGGKHGHKGRDAADTALHMIAIRI